MEQERQDQKRTWGKTELSYTRIPPHPRNPLLVEQDEHTKRVSICAPHGVQCAVWTLLITKLAGDHPMLQTAFKWVLTWLGGH